MLLLILSHHLGYAFLQTFGRTFDNTILFYFQTYIPQEITFAYSAMV